MSESSLKRWCDQGLIETVRTAGGHRKLPIGDVIRFLRERKHHVVCPEVLGMPVRSPQSEIGLKKGCASFTEALLEGNEPLARQIVFDLYLAKHSIPVLCDEVISRAFQDIGRRWQCNTADVYQERRGCEFTHRILYELRRSQQIADPSWKACGGTIEGDAYTLQTTMVELVLRHAEWDATSLGASIPIRSMVLALNELKPRLFWVCVSHVSDPDAFVRDFKQLSDAAEAIGTAIAVGGRALTLELRQQMTFCCHTESMQQLEAFAKSVRRIGTALMS